MNKKYDNNNIIIASRAYFLQEAFVIDIQQLVTATVDGPSCVVLGSDARTKFCPSAVVA
jgi:hypothetical protein